MWPALGSCWQSPSRRARTMLRLPLLLILLTHRIRTAYVTETPSFVDRLGKLYEKLERLTVSPVDTRAEQALSAEEKIYAKLEKLNSLSPERLELTDEDEELLSAMQTWGLSADELREVMKDLQRMRDEPYDEKSERLTDQEYADDDDEFPELPEDYPMDGKEGWVSPDDPELSSSTAKPNLGMTPLASTRLSSGYKTKNMSAVDPIAATNERPKILDDSAMTPLERSAMRQAALANVARVVHNGKCSTPQARWLSVRQLAPAADTAYLPPCVQLHRCAPDAGCCYNEAEVCAPIDGKYVYIPFYLRKANGEMKVSRMQFYNHTQCACASRDTLQTTVRTGVERKVRYESVESRTPDISEGQNDWRVPTEEPKLEKEDEATAPPQLRRCTCPTLFLANMSETGPCSCVCDWRDQKRRRDCLSLARGKEHFGLRDRVCIGYRDCNQPTCEYGTYDMNVGKCPLRRYRRIRYHARGRHQLEKTVVV